MSVGNVMKIFTMTRNRVPLNQCKRYYERRRRKGDGTKTDIFEEKSAASQEEYFRKETVRQLEKIRLNLEKEDKLKEEEKLKKEDKLKKEKNDKENEKLNSKKKKKD